MMVRAKFKLTEITTVDWAQGKKLHFNAVCGGSEENISFSKYTPSGNFEMYVDNPAALEQFELGKEYYLDMTPAN